MIIRAAAERPVVLAFTLLDREIVNAGDTKAHQPVLVEFPILIAVAAEPIAAVVVPLIGEAHGDAVLTEGPNFLDQAVVELSAPLAPQECFDGLTALEELRSVPPTAVFGVGKRNASGIARVPSSAMRAFCAAVSAVKGGSGGRLMACVLV
jgi:hypothetical protein